MSQPETSVYKITVDVDPRPGAYLPNFLKEAQEITHAVRSALAKYAGAGKRLEVTTSFNDTKIILSDNSDPTENLDLYYRRREESKG